MRAGQRKNTAHQIRARLDDDDDGFPAFALTVVNHSSRPTAIGWRVEGEGSRPVGSRDLATLTAKGLRADGRLPSGVATAAAKGAAEIDIVAIEDRVRDPCEGFRVVLADAGSGKPLFDRYQQPVIAHGQTREHFAPGDSTGDCRADPVRG